MRKLFRCQEVLFLHFGAIYCPAAACSHKKIIIEASSEESYEKEQGSRARLSGRMKIVKNQ